MSKPDYGSLPLSMALTPNTDEVVLAFANALVESFNAWQIQYDSD